MATSESPRPLLITGGTGGLGHAVVKRLLDDYTSIVLYRSAASWQQLQRAIGPHVRLHGLEADLLDAAAVQRAADQVRTEWGAIYGLVHLAGGFETGALADTTLEGWNRLLSLNLTSAFIVTKAVLPQLREQGSGRIVAIGSATVLARPAGRIAYNVSKAGLQVLIETLANELQGTRITANVLLPSSLDTPAMRGQTSPDKLVPLDRMAETIAFLLSDAAGSITGASIPLTVMGGS